MPRAANLGAIPGMRSLEPLMALVENISEPRLNAHANWVREQDARLLKQITGLVCEIGKADLSRIPEYGVDPNLIPFIDHLIHITITDEENEVEELVQALVKLREKCPSIKHHQLICEALLMIHNPDLVQLFRT